MNRANIFIRSRNENEQSSISTDGREHFDTPRHEMWFSAWVLLGLTEARKWDNVIAL